MRSYYVLDAARPPRSVCGQISDPGRYHPLPLPRNAFANDHRIRARAETLQISLDQANTAFAAYASRDTAEDSLVEQLLILQYRLYQATRAAREPGLGPSIADRMRRTMIMLNRDLVGLSQRLEKRQTQTRGILPQQYWRDQPIKPIGPYEAGWMPASPWGPVRSPPIRSRCLPRSPRPAPR